MNDKYKLFPFTISLLSIFFLVTSCNIYVPSLNSTDNSLSENFKSSESEQSEVIMAEYKKLHHRKHMKK